MAQIVVGVPGPWRERTELMEALARQGTDYMFAGLIFMGDDRAVQRSFIAGTVVSQRR